MTIYDLEKENNNINIIKRKYNISLINRYINNFNINYNFIKNISYENINLGEKICMI